MPNITRGGNARGLMSYLLGPGRSNEHTDQHIIAGTEDIAHPDHFGGRPLSHNEALRVGHRLDLNRTEHGTEVIADRTRWDYNLKKMVSTGKGPAHVWHCSLTLHPDEGSLSDETWAKIANDFMNEMRLTGSDGKAPCRWVAVRHGLNAGGGDHIHIACVLVREDGRKADVHRDFNKAQAACNKLEHRYNLDVLEAREHNRGARSETPAEQAKAARDGQDLTERARLELAMRAAAASSSTESEFLTELRAQRVLIRPRYARGTRDYVEGFSVALPPADGGKPVWFGASHVARDLSLRRLRQGWTDISSERRKALDMWRSPARNSPGNQHHRNGPTAHQQKAMWDDMARAVDESLARFDAVAYGDDDGIAACARQAAGIFSALSYTYGDNASLARVARRMGAIAQSKRGPIRRPPHHPKPWINVARACLHGPKRHRRQIDTDIWQAAARLARGLADTLDRHDQPVTARRLRNDIRALTTEARPSAVALGLGLLDATFGPAAIDSRSAAAPQILPRRPRWPRDPSRGPTR